MTDIAIPDTDVFRRFLAAADDGAFDTDPDQVSIDIIGRILDATTVDDVLDGAGAIHARDFLARDFALTSVRFNRSSFEGAGPRFYALLEGATSDGEKVVVTCGAKNVIAQAWKLADMGALPVGVRIVESPRETQAGYRPMWLERAESSF